MGRRGGAGTARRRGAGRARLGAGAGGVRRSRALRNGRALLPDRQVRTETTLRGRAGAAGSRNQATGGPPRGAHAHSVAAGACAVASRPSPSLLVNPTAEWEERACAGASLRFSAQPSGHSRCVHLLVLLLGSD